MTCWAAINAISLSCAVTFWRAFSLSFCCLAATNLINLRLCEFTTACCCWLAVRSGAGLLAADVVVGASNNPSCTITSFISISTCYSAIIRSVSVVAMLWLSAFARWRRCLGTVDLAAAPSLMLKVSRASVLSGRFLLLHVLYQCGVLPHSWLNSLCVRTMCSSLQSSNTWLISNNKLGIHYLCLV